MPLFPDFPYPAAEALLLGLCLLLAVLGGVLARHVRLPPVTGYVLVGCALGPFGLAWLTEERLAAGRGFVDIALGLVLFELGRHLDLRWARRDRALWRSTLIEGLLAFSALFAAFYLLGYPALPSALVACIGMACSPALIAQVARELRAEGLFTRRTLWLVAGNNLLALLLFTALVPFAHAEGGAVVQSLYRLGGSLALGAAAGLLALVLARLVGKRQANQFVLLVALIVGTVAVARLLHLSVLTSLLCFGIAARNLDRQRRLVEVDFGQTGLLFFIVLFVALGASLEWQGMAYSGFAILLFLLVRALAKSLGTVLGRAQDGGWRASLLSAAAMMPLGGVALGMTHTVKDFNPILGSELAAIVLSAVALLSLFGPLLTQFALVKSGETHEEALQ